MNEILIQEIISTFNKLDSENRDVEDQQITVSGIKYGFKIIENTGWEDDDKYDFKTTISQLVSYDEKWNVIDKFDIYVEQHSSRTGSYYTDWYLNYDEIERIKRVEKIISEQIIPEHIIIEWVKENS